MRRRLAVCDSPPPAPEPLDAARPESAKPGPRRSNYVLLCESIHSVLAAERALLAAGVRCDLAPVPRALASDCGMCVTLQPEDLERARPVLRGARLRTRGLYEAAADGYRPIPL